MNQVVAVGAGALALLAAVLAVTRANAVHGLLQLIGVLLALSASCFALGAGLAAVLLILIYVGTIVVVFVFVVIALDTSPEALAEERAVLARAWPVPAAIATLVAVPILFGLGGAAPGTPGPVEPHLVGRLLFGPWVLAAQLAAFLLLAALIGVRHIGRGPGEGGGGAP
jgi:NADH-quinone oxidoreductase subunit J